MSHRPFLTRQRQRWFKALHQDILGTSWALRVLSTVYGSTVEPFGLGQGLELPVYQSAPRLGWTHLSSVPLLLCPCPGSCQLEDKASLAVWDTRV